MKKIPKNEKCPCGSGKKYKNCHLGKVAEEGLIDHQEVKKLSSKSADASPVEMLEILKRVNSMMRSTKSHEASTWTPKDLDESIKYLGKCARIMHKETDACYRLFALGMLRDSAHVSKARSDTESFAQRELYGRIVVRAFLAEIEGVMYAAKKIILWSVDRGEFNLTEEEQRIADEINNNNFMPTLTSVKLTTGALIRLIGVDNNVDYSSHEWRDLKELHSYRNDITHPKDDTAYLPHSDVHGLLRQGSEWFYGLLKDLEVFSCEETFCAARQFTLEEIVNLQIRAREKGMDLTKEYLP